MWKSLVVTGGSGAAKRLSSTSIRCSVAIIQATPGNANNVRIGGSDVGASQGLQLVKPGSGQYPDRITLYPQVPGNAMDLSDIYIYAADTSGVEVLYYVM